MTHKNGGPLLQGEDTACSRCSIRQNDVVRLCQRLAFNDFWAQRRYGRCADSVLNDLRVSINTSIANSNLLTDS